MNTTSGVCHSVYTYRWPFGVQDAPADQTVIYTEWHITRYRIDTINSPDDGHMDTGNM